MNETLIDVLLKSPSLVGGVVVAVVLLLAVRVLFALRGGGTLLERKIRLGSGAAAAGHRRPRLN